MAHLDDYKLLSDKQHAYRKWHSCETQLATVINDWAKIIDQRTNGPVNAHLISWPSKAQNIQNLENIW